MTNNRLIRFLMLACITSGIRQSNRYSKSNLSQVELNESYRVADSASNSGCKCSSECGGEPQKWCRTKDNCGFPPSPLAMLFGFWDWCDNPRAAVYTVDLTCKCVNKHSQSIIGMAGQMLAGGNPIERIVTKELKGYWAKLPRSKVGGLGGRGNDACHALCPKMCCSAWQHDQENSSDKIPMYDGYSSCMFDVVGKIGNDWGNHRFLLRHGALTMDEEGRYKQKDGRLTAIKVDPEARCMNPGCSIYTGDLSKAYITGCPGNPRANIALGEVALDVAMAVGDFLTPQWQGPRLGLGNINPQMPNLGGMGGMAAAAYFGH
eukprot:TRINITY_DN4144_c0_g3_i1.p1 TRINITY_DN4144_c0_g3~~TRINITY_DN4144_c0_g3_i1.p1  ORF type:complete len:319 (-),score=14.32 TRINITY_DN4144_c0_g3_i1:85-1041(-)